MSERVGFWADMDDPYITYDNRYIESVWWSLKQIFDRGLLYKGHKVVPYCPRCGTALSSHEVTQGYKEVTEDSVFVRFRIRGEENAYFYAWTTTPWTLPSNVALCVGPDFEYCRFRAKDGSEGIMARALLESVMGEGMEILATMKGSELAGMEYEPLYRFIEPEKPAWRVITGDYVTLTDGTGIVHIAPAFGEDDARVGRENDLPFVQLVDTKGCMARETAWPGVFVKKADPMIIADLESRGLLVKKQPYTHNYPFCWRCDTPLIYYARSTWFIRMTALRDKLLANNQTIHWMPDNIKDGRMGNFLENVIDWGLSRERYWGTPLPIWICKDCGHMHAIGSIAELREMGENVPEDIELHKPFIDRVRVKCPKCHGDMERTSEVIDCWYDSGSMPFAQWHYPFENQEIFQENFPADFISEAIDQTRGWFYTLLAIGTLIFDRAPFENCLVLGHVQDKDGQKMSKHKGNVVDPWDVLDKQGADAVRWYFYSVGAPWLPSRFSSDMVSESQRKFMGTLWNVYAFFCLYASIDGYDPQKEKATEFTRMDEWLLSRLNTLVKTVDEGLAAYNVTESARAIAAFVDELSNWYVRRSRERFWGKGMQGGKLAAFETLYTVLKTLCGLLAPFTPFMAETMYQNLRQADEPDSVHLTDFPACDAAKINPALEADMETVIEIVQLGRGCRSEANLKVRQPLAAAYVKGARLGEEMAALIAEELNVKDVRFVDDARAFTTYQLKPQMRTLGPKYGKRLRAIGEHLANMDGNDVVDAFARGETVSFEIEGETIALEKDDVLTSPAHKPGFVAATERELTVVLDTNLTPALVEEGFVREVISKIQTMRKDADFDVTDRIAVAIEADEKLTGILEANREALSAAVFATSVAFGPAGESATEWNINGEKARIHVEVAPGKN